MRHATIVCAVAALVGTGCYLHHERSFAVGPRDGGTRDVGVEHDAGATEDAGSVHDAGIDGCVGPDCDVVADFDGLRWELPCGDRDPGGEVCNTDDVVETRFVARGVPGARYAVTLRFRGVVETARYMDGTADGHFYIGGSHYGGAWNLYALEVASPRETFFLNHGPEGDYFCLPIDYTREVLIDTGARVILRAESIEDREIVNRDETGSPIVIPDVEPWPDAFDGQFIQMDVLAVRRVR